MAYNDIKEILPRFRFMGNYVSSHELTSGNINDTYVLTYRNGERTMMYTLQRINTYVFKDPQLVMQNIASVTNHLKANQIRHGSYDERHVLELVRTVDGDVMHKDARHGVWRAYTYITDALALDVVDDPAQMEEVGRAFGRFQRDWLIFRLRSCLRPSPIFTTPPSVFMTLCAPWTMTGPAMSGRWRTRSSFSLSAGA